MIPKCFVNAHLKKHFDEPQTSVEMRQATSHEQFLSNIQYQMLLARAQMAQGGLENSLALSQVIEQNFLLSPC
jgi:ATP/maltotriose-dependent transcriptional regulator MalT